MKFAMDITMVAEKKLPYIILVYIVVYLWPLSHSKRMIYKIRWTR